MPSQRPVAGSALLCALSLLLLRASAPAQSPESSKLLHVEQLATTKLLHVEQSAAAEPDSAAATLSTETQAQPEEDQAQFLDLDQTPADGEQPSYRGLDPAQNAQRFDGMSGQESFSSAPLGSGVDEDADRGNDVPRETSAGPGSGWRSVEDGGRRAGAAYVFSQAAVREFHVDGVGNAAGFGSALYGHVVGGVITRVSLSGEQSVHGMAFYNVRSSAWAAGNPFNYASTYHDGVVSGGLMKPSDVRQQFAGRIGGPIGTLFPKKNNNSYINKEGVQGDGVLAEAGSGGVRGAGEPRLFYLLAFDAQRRSFPAVSSPENPNFYRLTAMQTALLENRGVTASATNSALNYLASLTGTVDRCADQMVNFARLDWARTERERLLGEYNRARWSNPAGARSAPVVNRGIASLGSSYGSVDMGVVRWVRFVRRNVSNELRMQYGRELQYEKGQQPLAQEPAVGPGGLPPEISIGPEGLVFGTPAGLGRRAYPEETRLEASEVGAWTRGRNQLQIGADLSLIREYTDSLTNAEGTFSYDSGVTNGHAGGLVDWITDYTFNVHAYPNGGCPSIHESVHYFCFRSYAQSFGQQSVSFAQQDWAGFVQDDWRATAALSVHAGVRYEYEFLPLPQRPNAALDAVFGLHGATSTFPEDRNNFGPRVGLEWRPRGTGGGVVRGGYGVYFGRVPGATLEAALLDTATDGGVSRIRILPTTETVCPQAAGVGFGYACSYLSAPSGVVAATTSAMVFDRGFRLPMVQQATLSVEHALGGGVLATAGYVTNLDRQLPGSTDLNVAPSTAQRVYALQGVAGRRGLSEGETFAVPVYSARVSPSFGNVTDIVSHANATYHGMTLEVRRGISGERDGRAAAGRGLGFSVRWTWSKAIDFAPNTGARPRADAQFDPFTVRYDKGLSALNQPHRISGTVVWTPRVESTLPGVADRPLVRWMTEGWSVAGIFEEASGRPYSYEIFGGTRLAGGRETINGSGGSTVLPTVGRNTLRLPDSVALNARMTREFMLGGLRMMASAQAFNVMNHRNVTGVQQRAFLVGTAVNGVTPLVFQEAGTVAAEGLNVEPFGTYTAAGRRERQVEFGVRVVW